VIFELAPIAVPLAVLALSLVVLVADLMMKDGSKPVLGWITALGMLAILGWTLFVPGSGTRPVLAGMLIDDGLSRLFNQLFLAAGFLTAVMSIRYLDQARISWQGEYYALLSVITAGMMFMAGAGSFVSLYVALELTTMGFYILVAIRKGQSPVSSEAGIKYLLLSAVASGVLLYGISLFYGVTGSMGFAEMGTSIAGLTASVEGPGPVLLVATVMVLVGLAFKVTFAPFHMWAPDVYEAAPTPVTGYLSVASKAAGFAALMRVFMGGPLEALGGFWTVLVAAMAALTLFIGNLVALKQSSTKRLLAYSSVSQAGYLALGLVAYQVGGNMGAASLLFYLVLYVFTNLAAFTVVGLVEARDGSDHMDGFKGLAQTSPGLALAMMVALLSLSGIPLTAGFIGKFYLFTAGFAAGWPWLVGWAVVSSIISLFYYLVVLKKMYIEEPASSKPLLAGGEIHMSLGICVFFILAMGCYPQPFIDWIQTALLP
jgi:NADH-quinone oxidoreductase subunit N